MSKIDYSKWDHIDTDSDDAAVASSRPVAAAKGVSSAPKVVPSSSSPSSSSGATVQGVIIRCNVERQRFRPAIFDTIEIPANHALFTADCSSPESATSLTPIPAAVGLGLLCSRMELPAQPIPTGGLDNQIVTYLNIDLESGFAPPEWQSQVGTALVVRKDKKPLRVEHVEALWMFCDRILNFWSEYGEAPEDLYNKEEFEEFWAEYAEDKGWGPSVISPYAV